MAIQKVEIEVDFDGEKYRWISDEKGENERKLIKLAGLYHSVVAPEKCLVCGVSGNDSYHSMGPALAQSIVSAYERYGLNPFHITVAFPDTDLRTNFVKLQYWGLVSKYITEENRRKLGWWRVTPLGLQFVRGELEIHKCVDTFNRKPVRFYGPMVKATGLIGGYLYRGDYIDMATPHRFT